MSQQVPQQMSRNVSNRSEAGPFRQTGATLQPLPAPNRPVPNGHHAQASPHQHQGATTIPDVGVNPNDYLAGLSPDTPYIATTGADLSPLDFSNALPVSSCPSMVSGWSAGDGTPMTRQNSFFNEGLIAPADMARWASGSQSSRGFMDEPMFSPQGHPVKHPYHDFLGVGANLSADMARSYSSSMQSNTLLLSPDGSVDSTAMERTQSNESTSSLRSTASSKRRHKEALDRVIKTSQVTPLAPKPQAPSVHKPQVAQAKKEGKVAVPKNTYQRRKPVKVFCDECDEHPEGFRGEHELRRHASAKHSTNVKKFICVDPTSRSIATDLKVVKPLDQCKSCRSGKQYGAYYNAAAHLRRQHFNPRMSRAKGKSDEKRGGKGGGDWPPMDELKAWYKVISVDANGIEAQDVDQDEDAQDSTDADMLEYDYSFDNGMAPYNIGQLGEDAYIPMDVPVSSAAASFGLDSQFADVSPVQGMIPGFMDDGSQLYSSPFSAATTITPSNLQDFGQLSQGDVAWSMNI